MYIEEGAGKTRHIADDFLHTAHKSHKFFVGLLTGGPAGPAVPGCPAGPGGPGGPCIAPPSAFPSLPTPVGQLVH